MLKFLLKKIFYRYGRHTVRVVKNTVKAFIYSRSDSIFLFILSPPYCGSTLLSEIICSSRNVSVNNFYGNREGQALPTVKPILMLRKKRWEPEFKPNWLKVKGEWEKYWDLTKPVLLEKSPPNILRAKEISNVFTPNHFIIFYRNPYAHCESLMRRNNLKAIEAAEFALQCLRFQKINIDQLKNKTLVSYEELTENTDKVINKLEEEIKGVSGLNISNKFKAHNHYSNKGIISNINDRKIANVSSKDLNYINSIFSKEEGLLSFFGYKLITY